MALNASTFSLTLNAGTFSLTDDKIEPGTVYIYTVSITENDDREGAFGSSLSVRSNGGSK